MDLIESNLFTPPIIVLQTVMEEVRHRSLPLFNRLKALLKADDKQTWVFYNEFRSCVPQATLNVAQSLTPFSGRRRWCERRTSHQTTGTTEVRHNTSLNWLLLTASLGIRKATSWYNTHLSLARPPIRGQPKPTLPDVVLLTDDAANRQKAEAEGIKCMSGAYPASLLEGSELT